VEEAVERADAEPVELGGELVEGGKGLGAGERGGEGLVEFAEF
jgi:hypothetical protein